MTGRPATGIDGSSGARANRIACNLASVEEARARRFGSAGFSCRLAGPTGVGTHGLYPSRDGTKLYVANRGSSSLPGSPKGEGSVSVVEGRIMPTITGTASVTAESTLIFEESDPFEWGIR